MTKSSKAMEWYISNISSDSSHREKEERTGISINVSGLVYRFAFFVSDVIRKGISETERWRVDSLKREEKKWSSSGGRKGKAGAQEELGPLRKCWEDEFVNSSQAQTTPIRHDPDPTQQTTEIWLQWIPSLIGLHALDSVASLGH